MIYNSSSSSRLLFFPYKSILLVLRVSTYQIEINIYFFICKKWRATDDPGEVGHRRRGPNYSDMVCSRSSDEFSFFFLFLFLLSVGYNYCRSTSRYQKKQDWTSSIAMESERVRDLLKWNQGLEMCGALVIMYKISSVIFVPFSSMWRCSCPTRTTTKNVNHFHSFDCTRWRQSQTTNPNQMPKKSNSVFSFSQRLLINLEKIVIKAVAVLYCGMPALSPSSSSTGHSRKRVRQLGFQKNRNNCSGLISSVGHVSNGTYDFYERKSNPTILLFSFRSSSIRCVYFYAFLSFLKTSPPLRNRPNV